MLTPILERIYAAARLGINIFTRVFAFTRNIPNARLHSVLKAQWALVIVGLDISWQWQQAMFKNRFC